MRKLVWLMLATLLISATSSVSLGEVPPFRARRPLRVVVYPFVPDKVGLFAQIKQSFEAAYPEVAVQIVDLSDNYYDEASPHAITNTDADILEVDSVFLDDLVASNRIQPLPSTLLSPSGTFAPVAEAAVRVHDVTYGVPHWLCTNYLFTTSNDALAGAMTLSDIKRAISAPHNPTKGLLIDLKGRSTLGEMYLDALLDRDRTLEKASAHLTPETFDESIGQILKDVRALCDADLCRDSDYHEMVGFYARQFAHSRGRALVGYSERLYYIGQENLTACKKKECVGLSDVVAKPLPLSDNGSQPFAWVDSFTVASSCTNQCLLDAEAFIRHTSSLDEVRLSLTPAYGEAPRYLLPALSALYSDKALLSVAPQYANLYPAVQQAIPVRGGMLNRNLRDIGKKLDKEILPK